MRPPRPSRWSPSPLSLVHPVLILPPPLLLPRCLHRVLVIHPRPRPQITNMGTNMATHPLLTTSTPHLLHTTSTPHPLHTTSIQHPLRSIPHHHRLWPCLTSHSWVGATRACNAATVIRRGMMGAVLPPSLGFVVSTETLNAMQLTRSNRTVVDHWLLSAVSNNVSFFFFFFRRLVNQILICDFCSCDQAPPMTVTKTMMETQTVTMTDLKTMTETKTSVRTLSGHVEPIRT